MRELTESEIVSSADPYITVSDYALEFSVQYGEDAKKNLSPGMREALELLELDREVHNGGIEQYFGNRSYDDGRVFPEVEIAHIALKKYGALKLHDLVGRSLERWYELIAERAIQIAAGTFDIDAWFGWMDAKMEPLNDEWYENYKDGFNAISAYIRNHPSEFCRIEK